MQVGGPFLEILTDEDVQRIHQGALHILERVGVVMPHRECLELLHDAGAQVDFSQERVRFPADLVEEKVSLAPSTFTLHGRAPGRGLVVGGDQVHFTTGTLATRVLDPDGKARPSTLADMEQFIRLTDTLDLLSMSHHVVHPGDVPEHATSAYAMVSLLRNSTKPFMAKGYGRQEALDSIRMAEAVAGGAEELQREPFIFRVVNPMSPLAYDPRILEGALEFARRGLPVVVAPEVMAGATGPATLAGSLAQQNAEILSGIVLMQVVRPGLPVVYGTVSSVLDMRHGVMPYGSTEACLLNVATAQMARFYGVPSRGTAGTSDSHTLDLQAGFETGIPLVLAALAGLSYMHSIGLLGSTLTASYEKLVVDHEVLSMVARLLRGFEVTEETMALDLIERVGPRGHFLAEAHTVSHFRKEHFIPELANRAPLDTWVEGGSQAIEERAHEKVQELLASHQPPALPEDVEGELQEILGEILARDT